MNFRREGGWGNKKRTKRLQWRGVVYKWRTGKGVYEVWSRSWHSDKLSPIKHISCTFQFSYKAMLKNKNFLKKYWWPPVLPLRILADTAIVSISKSYVTYMASYRIPHPECPCCPPTHSAGWRQYPISLVWLRSKRVLDDVTIMWWWCLAHNYSSQNYFTHTFIFNTLMVFLEDLYNHFGLSRMKKESVKTCR